MIGPLSWDQFQDHYDLAQENIDRLDLGLLSPSISHPFIHRVVEENYRKYFNDSPEPVLGIFNDFGQRCDDFKKDHGDKLHVLYAGCSFTYGEGVPIDLSWSGIVHEYINSYIADTSGYFNVGKGGLNFKRIQNQIMGYIKYSGKPDIIFINLPEIGREFVEYRSSLRLFNDNKDNIDNLKKQIPSTILSFRENLVNFKIMCDVMGIRLILGCWTMNSDNYKDLVDKYQDPFEGLQVVNTAGKMDVLHSKEPDDLGYPELLQYILDGLDENDPLRNIVYLALDDAHPGLLGHMIMAQSFISYLNTLDIRDTL